jgi:hypothetical protein
MKKSTKGVLVVCCGLLSVILSGCGGSSEPVKVSVEDFKGKPMPASAAAAIQRAQQQGAAQGAAQGGAPRAPGAAQ